MIIKKENLPVQNRNLFELIERETSGNIKRFSEMIGMSPQRINRLFQVDVRSINGSYPKVTDEVKAAVKEVFDVSDDFFDIQKNDTQFDINEVSHKDIITFNRKKGKPYYNVDFELGYELMENDQTQNPEYMIDFEPYNKCDCWCNARGNSMFPTISNGDVIAIKEIRDPYSCLISGEIYAIVTTNELRTIKRVKDNGDTITLIPDNKDYPEQTIKKDLLRRVYRVMGCMKTF